MSSPFSFSSCLAAERFDELVATHADVPVDAPDRQHHLVLAERAVPGDRVVVVGVDERAVDVEDGCGWHSRPYPRPVPKTGSNNRPGRISDPLKVSRGRPTEVGHELYQVIGAGRRCPCRPSLRRAERLRSGSVHRCERHCRKGEQARPRPRHPLRAERRAGAPPPAPAAAEPQALEGRPAALSRDGAPQVLLAQLARAARASSTASAAPATSRAPAAGPSARTSPTAPAAARPRARSDAPG